MAVTGLVAAVALAAPGGPPAGQGALNGPGTGCCCACGCPVAGAPGAGMNQQGGMGRGMGFGMGRGMGFGIGPGMAGNRADMLTARELLVNHESISRKVTQLPNGVETITTSTNPRIAAILPEHVKAMYARMKEGRLIRGFDPLFVALFQNADRIQAVITPLPNGVRVVETSNDPYAVKLIKAHAEALDRFVKEGMAAMHKTTPVPPRDVPQAR
jgi:hypothetical protein